jgi:hypothetical protein
MIRKIYTSLFFICTSVVLFAQTTKTGVLVIGNNSAAVAAAIQSARSGAKTMYLPQSISLSSPYFEEDLSYIKRIKNYYLQKERRKTKITDSLIALPIRLNEVSGLMKNISDTVKNLTVNVNNDIDEIKKDGKDWEIRLKGGQKIKAQVVVDASDNLIIAAMLKIDIKNTISGVSNNSTIFDTKLYRSVVALGSRTDGTLNTIPIGALIPNEHENFIIIPKEISQIKIIKMSAGQAAGTIAAYCAFFKTSTKLINTRVVQGELLAFDATLIPYTDIDQKDPNFIAFQRLGLSGIIKPKINEGKIYFDTAGIVKSEDIKSSMREYYTRSQLWFGDNKKDTLSIKDVIDLIKFNANRGEELNREIAESWKSSFKIMSDLKLEKPISRKEFGILADKYLQPFNIRIDPLGNLLR